MKYFVKNQECKTLSEARILLSEIRSARPGTSATIKRVAKNGSVKMIKR